MSDKQNLQHSTSMCMYIHIVSDMRIVRRWGGVFLGRGDLQEQPNYYKYPVLEYDPEGHLQGT